MTYQEYLESPEWKKLKRYALDRADNRCQVCNSRKRLNVHHRVYPQAWGEELLVDLVALCCDCHGLFHRSGRFRIPLRMQPMLTPEQKEQRKGRYTMTGDGRAKYIPPKPGRRNNNNAP